MIRDICFNELYTLPNSQGLYAAEYLVSGDIDGDGVDEILLCDREGNIIMYQVFRAL